MNRCFCEGCFEKQRRIDELTEEVNSLKSKLRYRDRRAEEGFFGSSTPSSKKPVKANTADKADKGKPGAKPGHKGFGRKSAQAATADAVRRVELEHGRTCPDCGERLEDKGVRERTIKEMAPLKIEQILYLLERKRCPKCRKLFTAKAPSALPRRLYGNQFISNAAVMHYLHGVPMGRIGELFEVDPGALVKIFHDVAESFEGVAGGLVEQYRKAPVKHADETGWRTSGKNGYAWLFATKDLSIFQLRDTRAARVPMAVLGDEELPGTLVVDRYAAYNKAPCRIQYCYSHLLREVEDLQKEAPGNLEIAVFAGIIKPLLAAAMGLRNLPISDAEFYRQASKIKGQIIYTVSKPADHPGIWRIQDIFQRNEGRMYIWASDRRVPADNNLAERDLRPTVIARKVSFGSQSPRGRDTRGALMTLLHTIRKRGRDAATHLKSVLDKLADEPDQDPFSLLFAESRSP